jgi:hypothetical protein
LKNELVKVAYLTFEITFNEQGWFNATEAAAIFRKRVNDWLAIDGTKEYLKVLAVALRNHPERFLNHVEGLDLNSLDVRDLIKVQRGGRGKSDVTWMHPKVGVAFARWLDVYFSVWCDLQIDDILSGNHAHYNWKKLRHEATASYKVLGQILQMTRERLGKATAPHHFSNEARLINYALTGKFGKVDRDGLSEGDLDLLARLENMDTVLLGCGISYEVRKAELERFVRDQRHVIESICLEALA